MANKRILFSCVNENCMKENEISDIDLKSVGKKRVILTCYNCGKVNEAQSVDDDGNANWLECIPFTGTERNHVAGRIETSAREVFWVDYRGKKLTAAQFATLYGVNPAVVWCNTHPEKPECKKSAKEQNIKTIRLVDPPVVDLKNIPAVKLDKNGGILLDSTGNPILVTPTMPEPVF